MSDDDSPLLGWLDGATIRPYVFVRSDNRIENPGAGFDLNWFPFTPVFQNPQHMDAAPFADAILALEEAAFNPSGMAMPRWVFYDCGIMPGFVAGFAVRTETLRPEVREVLRPSPNLEWTPISLFIAIPAAAKHEWVAHNLSSVNSLLARKHKYYGLGFLTKAFALWYANISICCGMTQWDSPALRLHSQFGDFEVLTAFTPVHSYAKTLTYRCRVRAGDWEYFFTQEPSGAFEACHVPAGFEVDPTDDNSLKALQTQIEQGGGPFFLHPGELRNQPLGQPLTVYRRRASSV